MTYVYLLRKNIIKLILIIVAIIIVSLPELKTHNKLTLNILISRNITIKILFTLLILLTFLEDYKIGLFLMILFCTIIGHEDIKETETFIINNTN